LVPVPGVRQSESPKADHCTYDTEHDLRHGRQLWPPCTRMSIEQRVQPVHPNTWQAGVESIAVAHIAFPASRDSRMWFRAGRAQSPRSHQSRA
jgi:hypothetical protein